MLALRPARAPFIVAALVLGNINLVIDQLVMTDRANPDKRCIRVDRARAEADRALAEIDRLERRVAELDRRIDEALRLQQRWQQRIDEQREQQAPIWIDRCCTTNPLCCV
jgi:hypothetical protein